MWKESKEYSGDQACNNRGGRAENVRQGGIKEDNMLVYSDIPVVRGGAGCGRCIATGADIADSGAGQLRRYHSEGIRRGSVPLTNTGCDFYIQG